MREMSVHEMNEQEIVSVLVFSNPVNRKVDDLVRARVRALQAPRTVVPQIVHFIELFGECGSLARPNMSGYGGRLEAGCAQSSDKRDLGVIRTTEEVGGACVRHLRPSREEGRAKIPRVTKRRDRSSSVSPLREMPAEQDALVGEVIYFRSRGAVVAVARGAIGPCGIQ